MATALAARWGVDLENEKSESMRNPKPRYASLPSTSDPLSASSALAVESAMDQTPDINAEIRHLQELKRKTKPSRTWDPRHSVKPTIFSNAKTFGDEVYPPMGVSKSAGASRHLPSGAAQRHSSARHQRGSIGRAVERFAAVSPSASRSTLSQDDGETATTKPSTPVILRETTDLHFAGLPPFTVPAPPRLPAFDCPVPFRTGELLNPTLSVFELCKLTSKKLEPESKRFKQIESPPPPAAVVGAGWQWRKGEETGSGGNSRLGNLSARSSTIRTARSLLEANSSITSFNSVLSIGNSTMLETKRSEATVWPLDEVCCPLPCNDCMKRCGTRLGIIVGVACTLARPG